MKNINVDASFDSFETNQEKVTNYRFDIFKGVETESGKVEKIRSVGSASLRDGFNTYLIQLKTLLDDRFYMLPSKDPSTGPDFVILTRELARNSNRKYFWNMVGEVRAMSAPNQGILKLSWDLFGEDLYLNTHPKKSYEASAPVPIQEAA
jgi:hypothetical protein